MQKYFKPLAFAEGISLLVLMGIAMPMKYLYGDPTLVRIVGWIHGLLFMAYVGFVAVLSSEDKWPMKKTLLALLAGILPFGVFIYHPLKRDQS